MEMVVPSKAPYSEPHREDSSDDSSLDYEDVSSPICAALIGPLTSSDEDTCIMDNHQESFINSFIKSQLYSKKENKTRNKSTNYNCTLFFRS